MSNGINVDSGGRVQLSDEVAAAYTPVATDVYINGWLVDGITGNPYYTTDANLGVSDVFINGIRHTVNGVRYFDEAVKANKWPEGFAVGNDGRQGILDANGTTFIRGIGRGSDGLMSVALSAGGDALDNVWDIDNPPGNTWTYLDFNRNSAQPIFGGSFVYMTIGTFNFEQFGAGGINLIESTSPAVANLDNNRYRCRRLSGDEITNSTFFPTNDPIGQWSVWRGGNPGAPLQRDSMFYSIAVPGSLLGSWQVQIEEPDGSDIIIVDRTISLGITRT